MRLHLIRHAKTKVSSDSGRDFDRNLAKKGKLQGAGLAEYLSGKLDGIEVYCSSANRTRQTLSLLKKDIDFGPVCYHQELYLCSSQTFLEFIWQSDVDEDLILIGHNFGISDLLNYLTDESIEMRTGEYVCIEFDGFNRKEVSAGTGTIVDRYRPSVVS